MVVRGSKLVEVGGQFGFPWLYLLLLIIGDILGHYDNVMAYGHQNNIWMLAMVNRFCTLSFSFVYGLDLFVTL